LSALGILNLALSRNEPIPRLLERYWKPINVPLRDFNTKTELMDGEDVEGLIENATDHRFSLEQAVNIARKTSWGLEFAPSRGIVHRDLEPGNV
jgi:serine/threonine protein kinase